MENTTKQTTEHNIQLTSSELSCLWGDYINNSLQVCVFKYFMQKVEDTEIKSVIDYSLNVSLKHVQTIAEILNHEKVPIPIGFTDEDVDLQAPSLFSDTFLLNYLKQTAKATLISYSISLMLSARSDVFDFLNECVASTAELANKTRKVLLSKGLYIRPPYIPTPDHVDFVSKQSFLQGWVGRQRPLVVTEISQLFSNIQSNAAGKALSMGFSQVAKSKEVREYFVRGKEIAKKHIEVYSSILRDEDIAAPSTWDNDVTESTVPPFSDKLMMFHITTLNSARLGDYGIAMSVSARHDLGAHYSRLMVELGKYSEDGINIMIGNGWLEQPSQAADRRALAGV